MAYVPEITARHWRLDPATGEPTPTDAAVRLTRAPQWTDPISEAGGGSITVQLDDSIIENFGRDGLDLVQMLIDGNPKWVLYPDPDEGVLVSESEEAGRQLTLAGPGHMGIFNRWKVLPAKGPGARPKETTRHFGWTAPAFDDSSWVPAKNILFAAYAKVFWGFGPTPIDPDFPTDAPFGGPQMVWADNPFGATSNYLAADSGHCWFRQEFSVDSDGLYKVFFITDNQGELYVDGVQICTSNDFRSTTSQEFELTAGDHVVAVHCRNFDVFGGFAGPGGYSWTIYNVTVGSEGLTVFAAAEFTVCVPYQDDPPGETAITALVQVLGEGADRSGWLFDTDFDLVLDSNGNAWDVDAEIATQVGNSEYEFMQELAATDMDLWLDPDLSLGLFLHAYRLGERGQVSGITYEREVNVRDSRYRRENLPVTATLLDTPDDWLMLEDALATAIYGLVETTLSLGSVASESEAYRIGGAQLSVFGHSREQIDVTVSPLSYADLDVFPGDRANTIDSTSIEHEERLAAYSVQYDPDSESVKFVLTFRDIIFGPDERILLSLKRGT
jgi:hypothetical protein